jgi:hypothetical protein
VSARQCTSLPSLPSSRLSSLGAPALLMSQESAAPTLNPVLGAVVSVSLASDDQPTPAMGSDGWPREQFAAVAGGLERASHQHVMNTANTTPPLKLDSLFCCLNWWASSPTPCFAPRQQGSTDPSSPPSCLTPCYQHLHCIMHLHSTSRPYIPCRPCIPYPAYPSCPACPTPVLCRPCPLVGCSCAVSRSRSLRLSRQIYTPLHRCARPSTSRRQHDVCDFALQMIVIMLSQIYCLMKQQRMN